ncbi:hypothetical protein CCACVL1_11874 [Corchorus capsularis]|uniref:Uncharacterized protein n=1 Tax=Corchorus capsularis TaxID=210143 RepID=A0A1R3IJ98_COCAP|nr:hypothetical protein CCACVL1_11874 [Corchorus capsularis]
MADFQASQGKPPSVLGQTFKASQGIVSSVSRQTFRRLKVGFQTSRQVLYNSTQGRSSLWFINKI